MPKPIFGDNGSGMHVHAQFMEKRKTIYLPVQVMRV